MSAEALQRVHAPIGLDIGAITPQEIAVSILAELIAVKHGKIGEASTRPRSACAGKARSRAPAPETLGYTSC